MSWSQWHYSPELPDLGDYVQVHSKDDRYGEGFVVVKHTWSFKLNPIFACRIRWRRRKAPEVHTHKKEKELVRGNLE